MRLKQSEASLKYGCESYLASMQNFGYLVWLRLNSGDLIIGEGKAKRRVRCCPKGTSDNLVILPHKNIFVEYKSSTGKMNPDQVSFQKMVENQHHSYWIVKDIDAFVEAVTEELKNSA